MKSEREKEQDRDRLIAIAVQYLGALTLATYVASVVRALREAYFDGASRVAGQLGATADTDEMEARFEALVAQRKRDIEASAGRYIESVRQFARAARASGLEGPRLVQASDAYATTLADKRSSIVINAESGSGRFSGAKDMAEESGAETDTWRFEHLLTGSPGHEECEICVGIREDGDLGDGVYSAEAAHAEGLPDLPHPGCDHGWILQMKEAA